MEHVPLSAASVTCTEESAVQACSCCGSSRCSRRRSGGSATPAGRLPVPDRQVLFGILYVLHNDIQWEHLPKELGFGSGMTCWRRLRDWDEVGVWQRLHEVLLAELNAAARLDWSRCVVDSSHVRAPKKGDPHGPVAGRPVPGRLQTSPDH